MTEPAVRKPSCSEQILPGPASVKFIVASEVSASDPSPHRRPPWDCRLAPWAGMTTPISPLLRAAGV